VKARLKDVPVGSGFVTTLTGRRGGVVAQHQEYTAVMLEGEDRARELHPLVVVDAEEVAH